jgi:hypothetical protein
VVSARRGASRLGCLIGVLLIVTAVYFGANIGEVYLRNYRLRDAMSQEARFAQGRADTAIRARLRAVADSLGLPDEAGRATIRRARNRIVISSSYVVLVELPLFVHEFRFAPRVEHEF